MPYRQLNRQLSKRTFQSSAPTVAQVAAGTAIVITAIAVSALVNRFAAKKAERDNPPVGKFVEVGGVRLHYVDHGKGKPLVLLHGNAGMIEDFASSDGPDRMTTSPRTVG
jgi:hypothetical protein